MTHKERRHEHAGRGILRVEIESSQVRLQVHAPWGGLWPRSAATASRPDGSGRWSSTRVQVTPRPCRAGKRSGKSRSFTPIGALCFSQGCFRRHYQSRSDNETARKHGTAGCFARNHGLESILFSSLDKQCTWSGKRGAPWPPSTIARLRSLRDRQPEPTFWSNRWYGTESRSSLPTPAGPACPCTRR